MWYFFYPKVIIRKREVIEISSLIDFLILVIYAELESFVMRLFLEKLSWFTGT